MMTSADSHARHVLSVYSRDGAGPATMESSLLQKLIADEIQKAVGEDREALREKMDCDRRDPCEFSNVCSHHKALAGAILASQLTAR
jgi:hypothetical protein